MTSIGNPEPPTPPARARSSSGQGSRVRASDIDPAAVMAAHRRHGTDESGMCYALPPEWSSEDCEPYRLAEAMQRWQWEHALANDGCVLGSAYRDVCEALAAEQAKVARVKSVVNKWEHGFIGARSLVYAALADQPEREET